MNISKTRIIAAVRRELTLVIYKGFPREIRDQAVEQLIPFLERLPQSFYDRLPEPKLDNDRLITEIVRKALEGDYPELVDAAR